MAEETPAERWRLVRGADIPRHLRHLLLILQHYQRDNQSAWCSRAALSDELGVCEDVVSQSLKALAEIKVVSRVWTNRNGRPTREFAIQYSELKKQQRTLMESSRCSLRESSECVVSSLSESSDSPLANPQGQSEGILRGKKALKNHRRINKGASLPGQEFPETLNTEEFKTTWSEWVQFRKETKKALTPSTVSKQLAKLEAWGSAKAVQSIENSISNGWQGLFDPDGKQGAKASAATSGADEALARIFTGLRKHDYETDSKGLRAFIGEKAWTAAKKVGWQRIRNRDQFTEKQIRTEFAAAWGAGT